MIKPGSVVVLSVALALGSGGCSWIFVQPLQPNYERGDPPNCTSNVAAPVIDTIFTTLDTIELVSYAGATNVQNKDAVLTGATLGIIMWGASAIYGYRHTSECADALAEPPAYRPYRRPRPPAAYRPPAAPPPPPPAEPPVVEPQEAAPPPAPTVTVPSGPSAPQQRDEE